MANYSNGSQGDQVKQIQTALNQNGANLAVDGMFGPKTAAAVKAYQQSHGLSADGIVGNQTWGSLFSANTSSPAPAATPAATPASNGASTSWDQYLQQARGMYDPSYNQNVQTTQSQHDAFINGLNSSKTGINTNYDTQITDINNATKSNQGQYAANMLGRGMGRSTLVTTGLAGINEEGQRSVDKTNTARNTALGNVDSQINQENSSLAAKLSAMQQDRETGVLNLAQQLKQYDDTQRYQQQQLALQQQQMEYDRQYKQQQLALQAKQAAASSASKVDPDAVKQQTLDYLNGLGTPSEKYDFVTGNKNSIIKYTSQAYYNQLLNSVYDLYDKSATTNNSGTGMGSLRALLGGEI